MKKAMFYFIIVTLFVSLCYAKTKNRYGYSVSAKLFNRDKVGVAVVNGELGVCFVSDENGLRTRPVFVEKIGKDIKYFYIYNYENYYVKSINDEPREFTISNNAEKKYILLDEIFPRNEAERIYNTVFFALGGKTGSGNWSAKKQIAREEERAGKELRKAPLENWKKQPVCYTLLKSRIKYWKNYNDEIKGWLAEIVKYENLSGYDDLVEYVEHL